MNQLKITVVAAMLSIITIHQASAQTLLKNITGKWKVVKYQDELKTMSLADTLEFKENGIFSSDSIYFKTGEGLFRTDETRSLLVIETNDSTTEWSVAMAQGVLRLRTTPKNKQPKVNITLVKVNSKAE